MRPPRDEKRRAWWTCESTRDARDFNERISLVRDERRTDGRGRLRSIARGDRATRAEKFLTARGGVPRASARLGAFNSPTMIRQ